jgi:ABC-type molybdenum transport system ATPase subunit/photorepair protein PhrA
MPSANILRSSKITRTPRVMQIEGLFDVLQEENSIQEWKVEIPLEEKDWNIGLIVGPSGCGKTTIAKELFGEYIYDGFEWGDGSIIDYFPSSMKITDIGEILSSVGFSSPPFWLRPFGVLSTGQKMRVNVARLLAQNMPMAVMDEFTSVVDRTVAQIGSNAIAKCVRRRKQKFIAVTCHYDVADWLQPDWIYQPETNQFGWRSLCLRPKCELEIYRCHSSAWELFKKYHYMSASINRSARCFVAEYDHKPVAFCAVLNTPHATAKNMCRISRLVCIPDYQGIGAGGALLNLVAGYYTAIGKRITITSALPSIIKSLCRNEKWILRRRPSLTGRASKTSAMKKWKHAVERVTASFEFVGKEDCDKNSAHSFIYG